MTEASKNEIEANRQNPHVATCSGCGAAFDVSDICGGCDRCRDCHGQHMFLRRRYHEFTRSRYGCGLPVGGESSDSDMSINQNHCVESPANLTLTPVPAPERKAEMVGYTGTVSPNTLPSNPPAPGFFYR